MGRRAATFKQSDITRAVKAAKAAGLDVARIEVQPDGTISVIAGDETKIEAGVLSPLEQWRANRPCVSG